MFYFEKLPDSLCSCRLWLTILLENTTVYMMDISRSFVVFILHIFRAGPRKYWLVRGAKKGWGPLLWGTRLHVQLRDHSVFNGTVGNSRPDISFTEATGVSQTAVDAEKYRKGTQNCWEGRQECSVQTFTRVSLPGLCHIWVFWRR